MAADPFDLRNTRARLTRLAIATTLGIAFTTIAMLTIVDTGRGPNADPVGTASVGLLAIAVFVVVTGVAYKALLRWRR